MKCRSASNGSASRMASLLAATLVLTGILTLATESLAVPMETGPQAKIPEVDEAACRANIQALADAEEINFEEYGVYTDPFSLDDSGILPGAWELCCPYDGSTYTVTFSPESFVVTCMCPHSHGRVVDGVPSWE